ncbi:MAG: radical SAM protein [Deltaproteobacteria bacterium]|nr:radical SAM protein [Deltaproteobacteria bacterium]
MGMRRSGFLPRRVVQVHLLERCNLRCSHCYSSSGPSAAGGLPSTELVERLVVLRGEGYEEIALSGGEPLMYGDLELVLESAAELGFSTSLITNGTVVTKKRAAALAQFGTRVAVSIDGRPPTHDRQRGEGSFHRAMNGAARLEVGGVSWGLAHCVTRPTLPDLPWLADLAVSRGARILQIRPLINVGRARRLRDGLDFDERQRVFAIAQLLQVAHEGDLRIQCDLAPASALLEDAELHGVLRRPHAFGVRHSLSDLVNPLVMDADGSLWPLAYGIADEQRIAGPNDWRSAIESYVEDGWRSLAMLLRRTFRQLAPDDATDWYAAAVEASRHRSLPLARGQVEHGSDTPSRSQHVAPGER